MESLPFGQKHPYIVTDEHPVLVHDKWTEHQQNIKI